MRPQPVPSPDNAEDGKEKAMSYNFAKLRGRMVEKNVSSKDLADRIGMASTALSLRLNGKRQFRLNEVEQIVTALDIPAEQIAAYFFTEEVA